MLEKSMRIIPKELETAIFPGVARQQTFALENEPESRSLVLNYLAENLQVRNARSELMPLTLVGMNSSYAESWLFYTIAASSKTRLGLCHTVLLEL